MIAAFRLLHSRMKGDVKLPMDNLTKWFEDIKAQFELNFIKGNRWQMLLNGLGNTIVIAICACMIGILIGIIIALVRTTHDAQNTKKSGISWFFLCIANRICVIYTTIIRGTPIVIQLMILYYIIFATSSNGMLIAIISFGINSGAYVSEIFRAGILSVEKGQMEAGRSLGLNYTQTMLLIVTPQMLRNTLPTLANEFIALLKETSIAGYVGIADLTYAGDRIRGRTYSAFMPLIAVAIIYLLLVMGLTKLVSMLERRLRRGDNH